MPYANIPTPPYNISPIGIGKRIYEWLMTIPVISTILKGIYSRTQFLEELSNTTDERVLLYYAMYGNEETKAIAYERARALKLSWASEIPESYDTARKILTNPSAALGDFIDATADNPVLKEITEMFGTMAYDTFMSMAVGGLGEISSEAKERVRRFMGLVVLMSTLPRLAGLAAEGATAGAIKTGGDILRDAYYNLGLGFITWQMTSPLIDAGVGTLLRNEAQRAFRPTRFTYAQVRDLYSMGLINYDEARERLAELGWRDEDINYLLTLSFTPLNESTLWGMWEEGIITDEGLQNRLRALGYPAGEIELLMRYQEAKKATPQKDVILSTARKAYKEGLIGVSRLREVLEGLNYSAEAIDLEIAVLDLEKSEAARSLSVSQLKEAYLKDVITAVEARNALSEIGFRSDEIETLLQTWDAARAPAVLRVNQSTIVNALTKGVLTEAEARGKLRELGYPTPDVDLIIATAQAKGVIVAPKATVGQLMEGVRDNIISAAQLEDNLRGRGYSPDDIALLVGLASQRRELELSPSQITAAYSAGVINRDAASQLLGRLGYSAVSAGILLDTTEVHVQKGRPQAPLGVLLSLRANDLIGDDELRVILTERGYSPEDIARLIAAATYAPPVGLNVSQIQNAYRVGVIMRDEAIVKLQALGYNAADAQLLIQSVEASMTVTQPRPGISTYVAAARDGIITLEELRIKLLTLGMAQEDVELYVQLASTPPIEAARELTKAEILKAYESFIFSRLDALRRLEGLGYDVDDADVLLRMVRREPEDSEIHTLYRARILTEEAATVSFLALGYTEEQVTEYFAKYRIIT